MGVAGQLGRLDFRGVSGAVPARGCPLSRSEAKPVPTRFRSLPVSAARVCAAMALGLATTAVTPAADGPGQPFAVARGGLGSTAAAIRVRLRLEVDGELFAPAGAGGATERRPVAVRALFDFDETSCPPAGSAPTSFPTGAVLRSYTDATADVRVGEESHRTALAADARRVLVSRAGTTPVPGLADGVFTDEEHDLLDTQFDPLLLDALLSGGQVEAGGTWHVPPDVAAGLLAIDTIESGGIDARLEEVEGGMARVRLSGIVDGAVDGVPTHVVVDGTLTTPARSVHPETAAEPQPPAWELWGPVARVAVVLKERRQASHVAPGLDVEARVVVTQTPIAMESFREAAAAPVAAETAGAAAGRRPPRRGDGPQAAVWRRDAAGRFDLVRDARWRIVEDGTGGLVMRFIDRGALVAQCSITALDPPSLTPEPPTAADLERDVRRSLAGQIGGTEDASVATLPDGLQVARVASTGTVGGRAFTWIHYAVTAPDGTRVNLAFTLEPAMRDRFGDADRRLIAGLRPGRQDRIARRAAGATDRVE
jgi:hypothetical protein